MDLAVESWRCWRRPESLLRRALPTGPQAPRPARSDGSWTIGALQPATWEAVTVDESDTFQYHCTEHPWAVGEITVEP